MIVKILTEHHLEAAQACQSLIFISKCLIVGNHMPRFIFDHTIGLPLPVSVPSHTHNEHSIADYLY